MTVKLNNKSDLQRSGPFAGIGRATRYHGCQCQHADGNSGKTRVCMFAKGHNRCPGTETALEQWHKNKATTHQGTGTKQDITGLPEHLHMSGQE